MARRYLLTVADVAEVLGASKWTVNRMVNEGRLPFQPVEGMGVRHFRRADIETYVGQPIVLDDEQLEVAS
jgi:excisionase family DNA binding protein